MQRRPVGSFDYYVQRPITPHPRTSPVEIRCIRRGLLGRPGHLAKAVIREILRLPFLDGFQNETGDQFGLVAVAVIGRRSAAGRIPHPVLAKIGSRDKRVDLTDNDAVLFELGACREAETKKRTLRGTSKRRTEEQS